MADGQQEDDGTCKKMSDDPGWKKSDITHEKSMSESRGTPTPYSHRPTSHSARGGKTKGYNRDRKNPISTTSEDMSNDRIRRQQSKLIGAKGRDEISGNNGNQETRPSELALSYNRNPSGKSHYTSAATKPDERRNYPGRRSSMDMTENNRDVGIESNHLVKSKYITPNGKQHWGSQKSLFNDNLCREELYAGADTRRDQFWNVNNGGGINYRGKEGARGSRQRYPNRPHSADTFSTDLNNGQISRGRVSSRYSRGGRTARAGRGNYRNSPSLGGRSVEIAGTGFIDSAERINQRDYKNGEIESRRGSSHRGGFDSFENGHYSELGARPKTSIGRANNSNRGNQLNRSDDISSFRYDASHQRNDDSRKAFRGRGYNDSQQESNGTRIWKVGFKLLRQLSEKEPSQIVMRLANPTTGLRDCLQQCYSDRSLMTLTLSVLAKAFSCNSLPESTLRIFNIARDVNFFDSLVLLVVDLQATLDAEGVQKVSEQINPIVCVASDLLLKCPSSADVFTRIINALGRLINDMRQANENIDNSIFEKFGNLNANYHDLISKQKQQASSEGPPDDFKKISIIPRDEDIFGEERPFLRKNKATGGYENLNDYLDVQFRLLREDFIGPLRDGITEYTNSIKSKPAQKARISDIRVYKNVRVVQPVCDDAGVSYTLELEMTKHLKHIKWKTSKRLIYGSMVCLTPDNFQTIHFATVSERDEKAIENGLIHIKFQHDPDKVKYLVGEVFTMAETTAYFESYKHVLAALQTFQPGDVRFENYIVHCDNNVKPPVYVTQDTVYDLHPLCGKAAVRKTSRLAKEHNPTKENACAVTEATNVTVLQKDTWPTAERLHLDESQFKALHTALTKEFVIIQGPPGTGKTYVGLKIVKALLHNREVWASNRSKVNAKSAPTAERPMLIVCYTNHALDQFLEGVTRFHKIGIVRVGGRSSSEIMNDYSLKNKKRNNYSLSSEVRIGKTTARKEMTSIRETIEYNRLTLDFDKHTIFRLGFLMQHMGTHLFRSLMEGFNCIREMFPNDKKLRGRGQSVILEWLGMGYIQPYILQANGPHTNRAKLANAAHTLAMETSQEHVEESLEEPNESCNKEQTVAESSEEVAASPTDSDTEFVNVCDVTDMIEADRKLDVDDIDVEENKARLERTKNTIKNVNAQVEEEYKEVKADTNTLSNEWKRQGKVKQYINRLKYSNASMSEKEASQVQDVWTLSLPNRWRLYRVWVNKFKNEIKENIRKLEQRYEQATERYKEASMQEDKEIMRQSTVIGMTTTGAARYQAVLQEIGPRIIVVEEAAEVLEAHIITTLNKDCDHLILIGDHMQLKPNPNVYRLAVRYNLNLSLFERMIRNNVHYDCLELQHRMRPDIADCLRHIYDRLLDHDSVKAYEDVKGVSSSVYFINHSALETSDDELKSHSNIHEAKYTVALCRYLLKQGYAPNQITVLTTYSGQLFCLRELMPKFSFEGVTVTVVDNYQGEENDIIILSLVRSNKAGNIGFLKTSNRVCVALSRAKFGFYVIGNFDQLTACSDLWMNITTTMKTKNMFGEGISLFCRNHVEDGTNVAKVAEDFDNAPEGGCKKQCEARLQCGHVCRMYCHVVDTAHTDYKCRQPCPKILCEREHKCPHLCFQACGDCVVPVMKQIPRCKHYQNVPCHLNPERHVCQEKCEVPLPCNHPCRNICGDSHTKECKVKIEKTWPCGHSSTVYCHEEHTAICPYPCETLLSCEHQCTGSCGKCFKGRLHNQCENPCKRVLICGHECQSRCNDCPPCARPCENRCVHSQCTLRCGESCFPCKEPCAWKCPHQKCTKLCCEPCNRRACNKVCRKRLQCNHFCIGLCGEPCPSLCRTCDKEQVTTIMFGNEDHPKARFILLQDCGHIVEQRAMDKYMNMKGGDEEMFIQLKGCPFCKTPIRRSYRYGNQINKALMDIESVKKVVYGDEKRIQSIVRSLEGKLKTPIRSRPSLFERRLNPYSSSNNNSYYPFFSKTLMAITQKDSMASEKVYVALENQVNLTIVLDDLKKKLENKRLPKYSEQEEVSVAFIHDVINWLSQQRAIFTEQEIEDAQREISRYRAVVQFRKIMEAIESLGKMEETKADVDNVRAILFEPGRFLHDREEDAKKCLGKLHKLTTLEGIGITEDERLSIVKAMGMTKGHWFKCPKNHIYAIGDCGGANQKGTCPECKADIGGVQHKLSAGNTVANEMDGAKFAAYSEEANNMGNFLLNMVDDPL